MRRCDVPFLIACVVVCAGAIWGPSIAAQTDSGSQPEAISRLHADLDAEITRHFQVHHLPCLVVLYAEDGELRYKRHLGSADVESGKPITETHVFRLASVSKLIAAVLALRLEEQGAIDLARPVKDFLPEIPEHHNASLVDLLACRGGVRHYTDPVAPDSPRFWEARSYATALEAADKIWKDPLAKPVGQYHYSTHGYTIFGACLERATGHPVSEVIRQQIAEPFGLSTLAAENRQVNRPMRVTLYRLRDSTDVAAGNVAARPDNISWKVCGGGLECSAIDLLRFGIKLCDGQILSRDRLARLMSRIDPEESYALGCNYGNEQGFEVLAKSGGQLGVNSYIWCVPELHSVMVVFTSRQEQGGAPALGQKLLRLVLAKKTKEK